MKLSWNWLSDFVDLKGITPDDLSHRLTMSTCEVDGWIHVFAHLDNVVSGKVLKVDKHPSADRLSVCQVQAGSARLQIVCGAPNVRTGMHVALAKIGALLPPESPPGSAVLEIRKAAIRGVESSGMLASAQEIGLAGLFGSTDGLVDLDATGINGLQPGSGRPLSDLLSLKDIVLGIDNKSITHRADLWSHFGFAREIAAVYGRKLKGDPRAARPIKQALRTKSGRKGPAQSALPADKSIRIEKGAAHAYFGLVCGGIKVTDTPLWMKARLAAIGQKSINNIVDASNYVLYEMGQPNHAFDAEKLTSKVITVSPSGSVNRKNLRTLDGQTVTPPEGTVLIYDGDSRGAPIALGGIIGGLDSAIAPDTKTIFLESATFPRERIRRTLSKLPLRTESAVRFEKGQDPANAKPALFRLVHLLGETCPALHVGAVTGHTVGVKHSRISFPLSLLQMRLGFTITFAHAKDILTRLHFQVTQKKAKGGQVIHVTVPTFRSQYDVTIPEDIVEEIGRIHGYDNIAPEAPGVACDSIPPNPEKDFERQALQFFVVGPGKYFETYNYSFADPQDNALFGSPGLAVKNQMPEERSHLRLSLIPGILRQAASNQDRFLEVRLTEFGRIYDPRSGASTGMGAVRPPPAKEAKRIALVSISGGKNSDEDPLPGFLVFRGLLEVFLNTMTGRPALIRSISDAAGNNPYAYLHPGCSVEFIGPDGSILGSAGVLHPAFHKRFDLKRITFAADLDQAAILILWEASKITSRYKPPSPFPDSDFELTTVLDNGRSTADVVRITEDLGLTEITGIKLLGVYSGPPLPTDKFSASYKFTCADPRGTLTGSQVQKLMEGVVAALAKAGIPLR